MTKTRWTVVTLAAFGMLLLPVAVGMADTPDGETPAEETVCDELMGGTPGLYGLCVAFCEAHDCEPDFSLENPFENCRPGSKKVLERYNAKREAADPEMPCLSTGACPCFSQDELDDIQPVNPEYISCRVGPPVTNIVSSFTPSNQAQVDEDLDFCTFGNALQGIPFRFFPVDDDEAAICRQMILAKIADDEMFCPQ